MEPLAENATLLSQLEKHAGTNPDKAAYIFVDKDLGERVITRQEIWDLTRKCAAIFKRLDLGKGDVICNTLGNSPERLITTFGTMAAGAAPSQGQLFLADGSDLIHNLKESKSRAIIHDPNNQNGAKRILDGLKYVDEATGQTRYKDLPNLEVEIEIAAKDLEESQRWMHVVEKEEETFVEENISKDETALIFVTSGTTGFSKIVPHSHSSLLTVLRGFSDADFGDGTPIFNFQSLGWIGGFPGFYPTFGSARIIVDTTNGLPENMGSFLITIFNKHKPGSGMLITRDIQSVLDAMTSGCTLEHQFQVLFTGGGPIHTATMNALGLLTRKMLVIYGGTEFLIVSAKEVLEKSDFQDMCAGRPNNCAVRIVGKEENDLPEGEQGEILISSGLVFKGYLNNPEKTQAAFTQDGWYRTGDIGYVDQEGQLFVLCRKADAINKNGFLHYPGWMEQLINKHHALEKAIVIGIPDPVCMEEICLCYKPAANQEVTVDDLREHCRKLFLTDEKDKITPVPVHYLVFDDIITNANGKVDRKKMKEEVLERLKNEN